MVITPHQHQQVYGIAISILEDEGLKSGCVLSNQRCKSVRRKIYMATANAKILANLEVNEHGYYFTGLDENYPEVIEIVHDLVQSSDVGTDSTNGPATNVMICHVFSHRSRKKRKKFTLGEIETKNKADN
jgi:hypothetical protein